MPWPKAEFATIRLRLLKVAARVTETASRARSAFASACPDAILFRHLAGSIRSGVPSTTGHQGPRHPLRPSNAQPQVPADEASKHAAQNHARCHPAAKAVNASEPS